MIKPYDTARLMFDCASHSLYVLRGTGMIEVHYMEKIEDDHRIKIELSGSGRCVFEGSLTELINKLDGSSETSK